jgi:hypothetical protein
MLRLKGGHVEMYHCSVKGGYAEAERRAYGDERRACWDVPVPLLYERRA